MQLTKTLTLDLINLDGYNIIYAMQADRGTRFVAVNFTYDGSPYTIPEDANIRVEGKTANNKDIYHDCIIENNTAVFELTESILQSDGRAECVMGIYIADTDQLLHSVSFYISIGANPLNPGSVTNSSEYSALINAMNTVNSLISKTEENIVIFEGIENDWAVIKLEAEETIEGTDVAKNDAIQATSDLRVLETYVSGTESVRQTNEDTRIQQESDRQDNEDIRQTQEDTRQDNEENRISNNEIREDQEYIRQANEKIRKSNEVSRQNQEDTRQNNEEVRKANDLIRQSQESDRQTNTAKAITDVEKATQDAIDATNNANDSADNADAIADYAKIEADRAAFNSDKLEGIVDGTGLVTAPEKGAADGVATLDENKLLTASQLPLGKTSTTAFAGDRGKALEDNIDALAANIKTEVENKFDDLKSEFDDKIAEQDENFETLTKQVDDKILEIDNNFVELKDDINQTIDDFKTDVNSDIAKISSRIDNQIGNIKITIEDGILYFDDGEDDE